jgi:hypothetical protein
MQPSSVLISGIVLPSLVVAATTVVSLHPYLAAAAMQIAVPRHRTLAFSDIA